MILTGRSLLVNATKRLAFRFPKIRRVVGVDFSGAAESGKTAWIAELSVPSKYGTANPSAPNASSPNPSRTSPSHPNASAKLNVEALRPLGKVAGSDHRDDVNRYLAEQMGLGDQTLWGCDFPFGLPIELGLGDWQCQLQHVGRWQSTVQEYGRQLVDRTERRLGIKHVRRMTDKETQTPFDCYHYRIIYQTFFGMRDVLSRIAEDARTCVLPFQYPKLDSRKRQSIVVEACPASTLKRLGLPHQRYKQSGGKSPTADQRSVRTQILRGLSPLVTLSAHRRRIVMNDPGGDALDAILAAIGSWQGFCRCDHAEVITHPRYSREGMIFC